MAEKSDKEEKKNIFEKIGDALSSRDEIEAQETAKKAAEEANAARIKESNERIAAAKAQLEETKDKLAAKKKADEAAAKKLADEAAARKQAEETAAKLKAQAEQAKAKGQLMPKHDDIDRKEFLGARPAVVPVPALSKYMIKEGDTLSGIAQKHYGHATRDYWMVIYEANKAVIGDNPGLIKPGIELTIPVLPPNLKGK